METSETGDGDPNASPTLSALPKCFASFACEVAGFTCKWSSISKAQQSQRKLPPVHSDDKCFLDVDHHSTGLNIESGLLVDPRFWDSQQFDNLKYLNSDWNQIEKLFFSESYFLLDTYPKISLYDILESKQKYWAEPIILRRPEIEQNINMVECEEILISTDLLLRLVFSRFQNQIMFVFNLLQLFHLWH